MLDFVQTAPTPTETLLSLGDALREAPREEAVLLCHHFLIDVMAGRPEVPFWSIAEEANDWASIATTVELKIYGACIARSLTPAHQRAFAKFVTELANEVS